MASRATTIRIPSQVTDGAPPVGGSRWVPTLRTRFLMIVLLGTVVPMGLIGFWLARSAVRAGEEVLLERMSEAVDAAERRIRRGWLDHRAQLLDLADHPDVQDALVQRSRGDGNDPEPGPAPPTLGLAFDEVDRRILRVAILDRDSRELWVLRRTDGLESESELQVPLRVRLPIYERSSGRTLGHLDAELLVSALLEGPGMPIYAAGTVLGAFDPASGASLLPLPFDPAVLEAERFSWGGEEWVTARGALGEPALRLVAAVPLGPVVRPFESITRRGLWVLLFVALLAFGVTSAMTGRVTGSIARLTSAAEAVAEGDLGRSVPDTGTDEVGRLGSAFNQMTASLRRTLQQLADRQALAAVGEFAATLAHDVRNALTSIRLDLQMMEERASSDPRVQRLQGRALDKVRRLDETVTGTLRLARSGKLDRRTIDLWSPLRAAVSGAQPALDAADGKLVFIEDSEMPTSERKGDWPEHRRNAVEVYGDPTALEELFLNLLLNAAQALDGGGTVSVSVGVQGGEVSVSIRDTGRGIPDEIGDRLFEPFVSSRAGGTGLGLTISRRIVQAHGGSLSIEPTSEGGTVVRVGIPIDREHTGSLERPSLLVERTIPVPTEGLP